MGFSEGIHPGKPLCNLYSINPFTKVNGNLYINSNSIGSILPFALADGLNKMLSKRALAAFLFISIKRLIQKVYFQGIHSFCFFTGFTLRDSEKNRICPGGVAIFIGHFTPHPLRLFPAQIPFGIF